MQERNNRGMSTLLRLIKRTRLPASEQPGTGDITVQVFDESYLLHPIWVGEGLPADVERAMAADATNWNPSHVLVGARLSQQVRRQLSAQGVPWADEAGRADIRIPPALAVVVDNFRPGQLGFSWSRSAGAVAECLMAMVGDARLPGAAMPPNATIADLIAVSASQVSRVLQSFDSEGWTRKVGDDRGAGAARSFEDPSGLLSSWAAWRSRAKKPGLGVHALWQDPLDYVTDRLAPGLRTSAWCLSGLAAADLVAPLVNDPPVITCYVSAADTPRLTHLLDELDLRPVTSGARIVFFEAEPHVLTFSSLRRGIPIAHPCRIYADLLGAGARGDEAASHVREVSIGY